MNITTDKQSRGNQIAAIGIAVLACVLSIPSLLEAWRTDLYARGGPAAFTIWAATLMAVCGLKRKPGGQPGSWTLLAALACAAGSMADLRVLLHTGLALAVTGLAGFRITGVAAAAAALAWMPAAGWFISRFKPGGLDGWERPAVATGFAILLVGALSLRPRHLA